MSFKQLENKIRTKLEQNQRKQQNEDYSADYYIALDLLDSHILNLSRIGHKERKKDISSIFEGVFKQHKSEDILKNYLLSLIINNNPTKIKNIIDNKDNLAKKIGFCSNNNLMFDIANKLINKNIEIHIDKPAIELDYIELRALYVLYKEHNIDILDIKDEYLRYSFISNNSRKTVKAFLAMLNTLKYDQMKDFEKYIIRYLKYCDEITNDDFYKYLMESLYNKNNVKLKEELLTNDCIDSQNIAICEYILSKLNSINYTRYKEIYNELIEKYANYRRFRTCEYYSERELLKEIYSFSQDKLTLAYFNNFGIEGNEDKNIIIEKLMDSVQFTNKEIELINYVENNYLEYCLQNGYQIKLEYEVENDYSRVTSKDIKILIEFEKYSGKEIFNYYEGIENNYYLPDKPKKIHIIDEMLHKVRWRVNRKSFDSSEKNRLQEGFSKHIIHAELKDGQNYKFSMYKYFSQASTFLNSRYSTLTIRFFEDFISYKKLFIQNGDETLYKDILNNIRRMLKLKSINKEDASYRFILSKINLETNSVNNMKKDLFDSIKQVDIDIENILNIVKEIKDLYSQNIWPHDITFSELIKLLLDLRYFDDMEMLMICEHYVYTKKLAEEHVYKYLRLAYLKTSLCTEYTEEVLKGMNLFSEKSIENLRISINYAINSHKVNMQFNENLKELCSLLGEEKFVYDAWVKNAIDFINSSTNINRNFNDKKILDIMVKVYDKNTQHYKLLESIVYGYLRLRSIEELDFSYIENLVKYYVNSKVFSEKSRHIATLIYKYKYNKDFSIEVNNDFIKYIAETLKYEIIQYDESNLNKEIVISTSTSNVKLNMTQYGLYAVELGYSLDDMVMISSTNKNDYLIKKRNYIRHNKNLFINEFNIVEDEEFKKFALEICVDEERYNQNTKEILLYPLNNKNVLLESKLLKDTYLLYFKNALKDENEDIEKIVEYIEDFIYKYKDDKDIGREFVDIIYKIGEKNSQKAIETLAFICGEYVFDEKIISSIRTFISDNIYKDHNQELIYAFDNMGKYISHNKNHKIFKDYLKSLNTIKPQSSRIILNICNKSIDSYDNYFVDEIIEILLGQSDTETLISLLMKIDEIQKIKFKRLIYEKVQKAYVNEKIKFNNTLFKYLIENYKGSINELRKMCELICKNSLETEDYKLIYEKSVHYIEEDVVEFRKILKLLDYEKAKEHLKNIKHIVGQVDKYFITNTIKKGYYISAQKGFNKVNEEVLIIRVMNHQLFNILADYIKENENIKKVYEKNAYNIIIKNPTYLTEKDLNLEIYDTFKLFVQYIDLYIEMLRYSYELPNITVEDLIFIDDVILPINISQITNLSLVSSNGVTKKNTINNREYNYSNKDKDYTRVSNIKECMLKAIEDKNISKELREFISENITSKYRDDLRLFKDDMINVMKRIKNVNSETLNMKDAIKDFELLNEYKKQEVIEYTIEKDIVDEEAYNNVLLYGKYESLEKDIYLISNFDFYMKSPKRSYIKVCNILQKDFINRESLDKDVIKIAFKFFATGARYNLIKDEKYISIINEIKFLDNIDKRSLLNLAQRNIETAISRR